MRPSLYLPGQTHRITLFTRRQCSLCETAKEVLHQVQARRPFEYQEINLDAPGQERWRKSYAYDIPVIHVEKPETSQLETAASSQKLMHRFTVEQVENLMDQVK